MNSSSVVNNESKLKRGKLIFPSGSSSLAACTVATISATLLSAHFAYAKNDEDDGNTLIENEPTLFARYTGLNTSLVASIVVSSDAFLESASQSSFADFTVHYINAFLTTSGVPKKSLLTTDEFVLASITIVVTLVGYYVLMGKNHVKKRKQLSKDLKLALEHVTFLEEKLMYLHNDNVLDADGNPSKPIRIFMDGAFDLMHYGHMNAFRLARSLGTHLVVGVNSDASITACKGKPLMKDDERLAMVHGCKFVDEVVPDCPYIMNEEYLNWVIREHKIDYVIHGDDPCVVNGKDVYEAAKKAGKFQSIPRTEGVSTTDIVGRMLLMTKDHHCDGGDEMNDAVLRQKDKDGNPLLCEQSKFLTTSRMLRLFSAGMKSPKKGQRIVYIDGAWDMFHCGHVAILKAAREVSFILPLMYGLGVLSVHVCSQI
jgi:ethanolamine-phosphate cytidylyltransferase